ncbi:MULTISPECIES: hypothetical protein [unclassified Marinobacter]|uniref:hypothetical protein n=1 Tax=unclassified Marinobacter TaxID=83889 RepID=UPI001268DD85|nr:MULTISPECIES: hypothetical protein [unclassified Marinobacter]QFS88517.1 hypothetical protein FIV08_16910 [Marinobacter sp. THAF197a]QFT52302.1 hypothetical protein FIU96_16815 [Marinobacter sp. THAF39]
MMAWTLAQEELDRMPSQQQRVRQYALARHLLDLPDPPANWPECKAQLDTGLSLAAEAGFTSLSAVTLLLEALHYVPDAFENTAVQGYLHSGALEQFRAERVLEWAREHKQHKENVDELS